jgi:opacity protein-like surface antigen
MKKVTLSLLMVFAVSLFANDLFGQGAYIKFSPGYGFALSSAVMYTNYTEGHDNTYEQVYGSLGKGLNIGAAFGYMFHKNIGFELGLNYLLGSKVKGVYDSDGLIEDDDVSARMLRIMPSVVISSGLEKVEPYAKVGMVVGLLGSITNNQALEYTDYNLEASMVMKMNGGIAIGLNASLGVLFNLSESIAFFGEIATVSMSYSPTKGEVTEFIVDGEDGLSDMHTSEKEYEYLDVVIDDPDPPVSKPTQSLKTKFPFGSIGPNFGIQISF